MKSQPRKSLLRLASIAFVGIVTLVAADRLAQAQEPPKVSPELQQSKEVQQLKEKLQKLEQTVEELKNQLSAIEKPAKTPTPAAMITPNSESPVAVRPATTATTPSANQEKKPGESTFQVYGFAMLDAGYQFKQNDPLWFDVVRPTKLPAFTRQFEPDGNTYFGVRQSRLGVKTTTPTALGELKTTFEFELFGTGNQAGDTIFRLRHAYGEVGHFGAGQYWSNFVDPDSFPNTTEYWGPNGLAWFRNVQFRWMPIKGNNSLTIGLERPGASGDQGVLANRIELTGIRPKFDLPDLTANARFTRGWGHIQISGLVRRIKWVDILDDQFDLGGSDVGWGIAVTSAPKFGTNNTARLSFLYGEGVENYLNDGPVDVGIKRTNSGNPREPIKGVALPALGMSAYLDHTWSKMFSSSIGYSLVNIDNSEGQAADAFHRGHYGSTNLLYYPVENAMIGAEFIWGRRENFLDGFHSDDYRIQFTFKYNFSKLFSF
jgi:cell division protein FtsB